MNVVPDSDIILIKSPLKLDNYNQLTFNNANEQETYFKSLPHLQYDGCTYVRKDGVIRYSTDREEFINAPRFEDLLGYNYCMYKNDSYQDKWFYAFVTDVVYINDGMCEVSIETDVFQSWQFDLNYMNSFIEREHVSDDTIGLHTIPEGLETGDYIINDAGIVSNLLRKDACYICCGVTYVPDNTLWKNRDRYYANIYSGLTLVIFKDNESCSKFIEAYDKMGRGEAITNLYMIPQAITGITPSSIGVWQTASYDTITGITFAILPSSISATIIAQNITYTNVTNLNTYVPKNNKLFVFPYSYLSISNNNGTEVSFKYEDFKNNTAKFDLIAVETNGCQSMLIPRDYKLFTAPALQDIDYNYGIAGGKFPNCSWNTDPYINWLTENGINILGLKIDAPTSEALGGTIEALVGSAMIEKSGGQSGSQIGSGLSRMFGSVKEMWKHSLQSPTLNGQTSNGDLCFGNDTNLFTYYKMSIKYEYAKIIDDFFTMYGYKVNRLATPNIHKRLNWDYIKTIDVNIEGNVPEKDLNSIRSLFNNGCTFWHNPSTFLNYSATNSIL